MNCEILCVGTELLLGDIINTNAAFLSKELAALGINVFRQTTVGDNAERLKKCLKDALDNNDMVITSGGLGPTYDDLTKETAAALFGTDLVLDEASLTHIEHFFSKTGRKLTDSIKKQAYLPKGAQALPNDCGTAPGIFLEKNGKVLIMLPGPPKELETMFLAYAVPKLSGLTGRTSVSHTLHIFGIGESTAENMLKKMMTEMTNPTVAPYAKTGQVEVRVTAFADSTEQAEDMTRPVINEIIRIIGREYVYGMDIGGLQEALVRRLEKAGLKIATAESLTGGMISKMITEVSGASGVIECGVCSYSNRIKHEILGVSEETLESYTEYSPQTAEEMAEGVRKLSGADIGISTTGIAGPGGGTDEKPVGLVYVGVSSRMGTFSKKLDLSRGLKNERELIRELASLHALSLALKETEKIMAKAKKS